MMEVDHDHAALLSLPLLPLPAEVLFVVGVVVEESATTDLPSSLF
jgi:hypothetical protein